MDDKGKTMAWNDGTASEDGHIYNSFHQNQHLRITHKHPQLFEKLNNFNIEVMGGNRKKQQQGTARSLLRAESCWPCRSVCIPPGSL